MKFWPDCTCCPAGNPCTSPTDPGCATCSACTQGLPQTGMFLTVSVPGVADFDGISHALVWNGISAWTASHSAPNCGTGCGYIVRLQCVSAGVVSIDFLLDGCTPGTTMTIDCANLTGSTSFTTGDLSACGSGTACGTGWSCLSFKTITLTLSP